MITILGFIRQELKNRYRKDSHKKYLLLCNLLTEKNLKLTEAGIIELLTNVNNELQTLNKNLPELFTYDSFKFISNPVTTWEDSKTTRRIKFKKRGFKLNGKNFDKAAGDELHKKKNNLVKVVELLDEVFQFIKLYELEYAGREIETQHIVDPGIGNKTKNRKEKVKRDTRPADIRFIESFVKTSKKELMIQPKDIERFTGVSPTWISNHFKKIEFMQRLYSAMEKEYTVLPYDLVDQSYLLNYTNVKDKLEALQNKSKFDKARSELKEANQEKRLGIKTNLKKVLST